MVTDPFLVGVFFGFVPAMGFLYILLHEYHALLNEKRIFRSFFLGMIAGVLTTFLEQYLSPPAGSVVNGQVTSLASVGKLAVYAGLLGLLEAVVFAAALNWKTYRGRRDTPFYGVAFGLGFGATNVVFLMFLVIQSIQGAAPLFTVESLIQAFLVALLGLYFVGGILVHAAMGVWIGQGAAVGPLPQKILRAALVRFLYIGLFYAIFLVPNAFASQALSVVGAVVGVALAGHILHGVLDRIVPEEVLREIGIHNRRLARRVQRGPDEDAPR